MHAIHSAATPVFHVHTQHCMTPYCTDSTQPGILLLCLFLASSPLIAHFERARPALASSCMLLFPRFCSYCVSFYFSDFLLFWRDVWVILVLCIFVCRSLFCEFVDFLHFREILVLVGFCSVCRFGPRRQSSTQLKSTTSDLFLLPPHTTAHLPHNHTLPVQPNTSPTHPTIFSLKTSHPTQQWTCVAQHTHRPQTRGRQTRTHSGATGRGGKKDHRR